MMAARPSTASSLVRHWGNHMSGASKKLMGTTAAADGFLAIEDVFSTYLYTGNGSTQTITNDIDLAGEGGLVWFKQRNGNNEHQLFDTERGSNQRLLLPVTSGQTNSGTDNLVSFNADGFTVGPNNLMTGTNGTGQTYASWTFRKAPRFFDVVTYTGDGTGIRTISHNLEVEPGFTILKKTSTASAWIVTDPALVANLGGSKPLYLNTAAAAETFNQTGIFAANNTSFFVGATTGSGPNFGSNDSGVTYVAYLFAHDPLGPSEDGSDGLIACGSYTGTGADGNFQDLGWEPQWIMIKNATSGSTNWVMFDNMRGMPTGSSAIRLAANLSAAEGTNTEVTPNSRGFTPTGGGSFTNASGDTYIYIAIRRGPMRVPESGTEVFAAGVVQNNTGRTLTNPLGYPSDMAFTQKSAGGDWIWQSRLTGKSGLFSNNTNAESTFYGYGFGNNTNYEADGTAALGAYGWNFRRAPGFFDVVAYTGDGVVPRSVPHNLGVAPEIMILKSRTDVVSWQVYHKDIGATNRLFLDQTSAQSGPASVWNSTDPTEAVFYLGSNFSGANASGSNYIAYLFASLDGVSKVGSYTGNGSSQTINCGFTTGARFILIKRTDDTGDWYVWDTARGIVTGNDPFLELNTTDAEVTTDDSIDPDSSGFIVNQTATTNVNVSSASYIFYAIA
jgi:hypothetical protein